MEAPAWAAGRDAVLTRGRGLMVSRTPRELTRCRRGQAVLQRAGLHRERDVAAAREEQPLALLRAEEEAPLLGREPKRGHDRLDGGAVLSHEQFDRGVGEDRAPVLALQEVGDVLGDR